MRADVAGLHAAQNHQRLARACATSTSGSCAQEPKQPTEASRTSRPLLVDGLGEGVVHAFGAVAAAAGAHADADARHGGNELGSSGFADGVECADILDAQAFLTLPCE